MDHKDFDKILSDKLKEEQDFAFLESDWKDLEKDLPQDGKDRKGFWLWFLGSLLALMAISYLCFQNNSLENKIVKLEVEVKDINEQINAKETIRKTVILYDTIYEKVKIPFVLDAASDPLVQLKNENKTLKNQIHNLHSSVQENTIGQRQKELEIVKLNEIIQALNTTVKKQQDLIDKKNIELNQKGLPILQMPYLDANLNPLPSYGKRPLPELEEIIVEKNKPSFFSKPQFRLGGFASFGQLDKIDLEEYSNKTNTNNFYQFGILTEFLLAKKIGLQFGLGYERSRVDVDGLSGNYFSINRNDLDELIFDFDPLLGVYEDLSLNNFILTKHALLVDLHLKYYFLKNTKLRPYANLGIQSSFRFKSQTKTEYFNEPENLIKDNLTTNSKSFSLGSVIGGAGLEAQFFNKISWQLEGQYYYPLSNEKSVVKNTWGIRTAVLYNF